MFRYRKLKNKNDSGAALIELLIVVPFLIVITFLSVAFIKFVNSYALSSQSIRESAQLGALFTNTPVGSSYCTCILNRRQQACESGCPTVQNFENVALNCQYGITHHPDCAHKIALNRVRRYITIVTSSEDLKEVNLTTEVTQDSTEIIFNVNLDVDHESFYNVFGSRALDVFSFAFIREDEIPSPSPSSSPPVEEGSDPPEL